MNGDQKFYKILFAFVFIFLPIHGERIITSSDIAKWYLDADLVVVTTLIERQTIPIRSIDTLGAGGYSVKCDFMKDRYMVIIDSTFKGCSSQDTITVTTPEYSLNCHKYRITENSGIEVSETGDTTSLSSVEIIPDNYDSGNYFRLGTETKNIILLNYDREGYETILVMRGAKDEDLEFLNKVSREGEDYFGKIK
jgi:hypothetical protein